MITELAIKTVQSFNLWGIAFGAMLESAGFPIPSELFLALSGFLVFNKTASLLEVNLAAAAGGIIGSLFIYLLGYYGGKPLLTKYGKYLLISPRNLTQAERFFCKYRSPAVFLGRMLPLARTFISLPAGMTRMNPPQFIIYSLLGILPWNFCLIFIGYKFGENYASIVGPIMKKTELAMMGILSIIIILMIARKIRTKKKPVVIKALDQSTPI